MGIGISIGITKQTRPVPWYQSGSALAQSIVGLWKLDEASGNRADSKGASTLTDNATVTSAAGIVYPLAAEFVIANLESLSAADSAVLSGANIDMWGAAEFCPTAVNVTSTIFGKWNTSGNREWQVAQVNADVILQTSPDGTATGNGLVTAAGVLVANTWAHVLWYHDAVNNLIGLSINGGAFVTAAYSTGIFNSAASFRVGGQGAGTAFFGGRIGPVMLGKNYVPSIVDASFVYNQGRVDGVRSVYFICFGGEVDWAADGSQLVFDRRDDADVYQLFTTNSDGGGEVCISDPAVAGGPTVGKHKGWPSYHPNGNYILCQAEMESHISTSDLAEPGRGWWNDVWVTKADGSEWWKLTNYSGSGNTGVLSPRFSPDGTKLFWASRLAGVSAPAPFAEWQLSIGDFAFVDGVPTLTNVTNFAPGAQLFYEAHGFSRDGTKLLYATDPASDNPYGPDIYMCDLDGSSNIINLTNSGTEWDEHAAYAPHADVIAWMSSRPYATYVADVTNWNATLKSEAFVMHSDGTNKRQLTHFNIPGFAEYNAERSVATTVAWHPDGNRAVVTQLLIGASYDLAIGRMLWMVNFNGVYE